MSFQSQPILRDFSRFLTYLGQSDALELTKEKGLLRSADLQQLNEQMHWKARMTGPKSQQPAYAVLNLFFHIVWVSRLAVVKKNMLLRQHSVSLDPERVGAYRDLSPDEQYFFLLESFWCYVNWEDAFEIRGFMDDFFYKQLARKTAGEPVLIANDNLKRPGELRSPMYVDLAEIFEAFGWIDLEWDRRLDKRPPKLDFPYQSAAITPLGKSMLPVLMDKRSLADWSGLDPVVFEMTEEEYEDEAFEMDLEEDDELENLAESLSELLIDPAIAGDGDNPYETPFSAVFPPVFKGLALEHGLYPIVRTFAEGKYIFRIAVSRNVYRIISFDGNLTLDDLHLYIQELFEFDNGHLYAFFMDGEMRAGGECYFDPSSMSDPSHLPADAFRIGDLDLRPGQTFLYLFDFGDPWQFYITLLAVEPPEPESMAFELIESVGAAPEQEEEE